MAIEAITTIRKKQSTDNKISSCMVCLFILFVLREKPATITATGTVHNLTLAPLLKESNLTNCQGFIVTVCRLE